MERDIHANAKHKKAVVSTLISDKVDFKTISITRNWYHLTMIKGLMHQEYITIVTK